MCSLQEQLYNEDDDWPEYLSLLELVHHLNDHHHPANTVACPGLYQVRPRSDLFQLAKILRYNSAKLVYVYSTFYTTLYHVTTGRAQPGCIIGVKDVPTQYNVIPRSCQINGISTGLRYCTYAGDTTSRYIACHIG